ncbi:hypothetical protein, partial [Aporhodopirellula aestuarii]
MFAKTRRYNAAEVLLPFLVAIATAGTSPGRESGVDVAPPHTPSREAMTDAAPEGSFVRPPVFCVVALRLALVCFPRPRTHVRDYHMSSLSRLTGQRH